MRNNSNLIINIIQYCFIGTFLSNIQRSYNVVVDGFSIHLQQSMRTTTTILRHSTFIISPNNNINRCQKQSSSSSSTTTLYMIDALFSEPASSVALSKKIASTAAVVLDSKTADTILDVNGKEFKIGSIVRVSTTGLKQYQLLPKGCGTFHTVSKEFIPDSVATTSATDTDNTTTNTPKKQCLELPIGLRGIITRIYNVDIVSANLPILVKFVPNEHIEEGYSSPVTFSMHFLPDEIECV